MRIACGRSRNSRQPPGAPQLRDTGRLKNDLHGDVEKRSKDHIFKKQVIALYGDLPSVVFLAQAVAAGVGKESVDGCLTVPDTGPVVFGFFPAGHLGFIVVLGVDTAVLFQGFGRKIIRQGIGADPDIAIHGFVFIGLGTVVRQLGHDLAEVLCRSAQRRTDGIDAGFFIFYQVSRHRDQLTVLKVQFHGIRVQAEQRSVLDLDPVVGGRILRTGLVQFGDHLIKGGVPAVFRHFHFSARLAAWLADPPVRQTDSRPESGRPGSWQ